MGSSAAVVAAFAVASVLTGWLAFRWVRLPRPPLGVLSLGDVAVMLAAVVIVPFLYLILPLPLVVGLFLLAIASGLDTLLSALIRQRWISWGLIAAVLAADVGAAIGLGPHHPVFLVVNNVVLVLAVASVTVLWAQSGLRSRDAAILCGAIGVYDLVATTLLPLTDDLLARLAALPLTPVLAWGSGDGDTWLSVSIGLGDLLLATLFPLVQRKAFGLRAGLVAISTSLATLSILLLLAGLGALRGGFPVMVALGPLTVLQYVVWRRRGPERTTWQYQLAAG